MRKALVLISILAVLVPCVFAGTIGTIDAAVEKKMEEIRNSGKTGQNVQEIKFKKTGTETAVETAKTPEKSGTLETLSALNVTGGIFEGGILGAATGLIIYSRNLNRDITSVQYGAIIGTIGGALCGVGLSVAETITKRYWLSDDYGYDILGGMLVGAAIGAAGGSINAQRTGHLENVSEGAGWGAASGAVAGLIVAIVETVLPESIRGGGGTPDTGTHAVIIQPYDGATVLCYNLKY